MAEPNDVELVQRIIDSVQKLDYESLKKLSEFISRLVEGSLQSSAPNEEGGEIF